MKKLRAVHIDDEQDSVEVLKMLLDEYCPEVVYVGSAGNVDDGLKLIENSNPDLLFLDIEMPRKNGFTLLDQINNPTFHTIMVTGYADYAIKAIKYSALDYLLKPISAEELVAAVRKSIEQTNDSIDRLGHLAKLLQPTNPSIKHLIINQRDGFVQVAIENIMYIQALAGSYCNFYLENGSNVLATKALSFYESILPESRFLRIHRSHVVNMKKIVVQESDTVKLTNGVSLDISVRKKKLLKEHLSASDFNV